MVQNSLKKILTFVAIIAGVAFLMFAQKLVMILSLFGTAGLFLSFPILGHLPILTVLILTFAGFGAITAWAIYKRNLKQVLFPGSILILTPLVAIILIVFSPLSEFLFNTFFFLPFLSIMLSVMVGVGAIMLNPPYRQNVESVFKLIGFTLAAILFSAFLWLLIYLGPMWIGLSLMPNWINYMTFWTGMYLMPRIITLLIAGFILTYLYWPGKKRGLFLTVLGPVFLLELLLFLTINLIVL